MSGELSGLIALADNFADDSFGSHQTLSYTYTTGVETGSFDMCALVGTGATSGDSVSRAQSLMNIFYSSGVCVNDINETSSTMNVNNVNISFSQIETWQDSNYYASRATGFSDKRHFVTYEPEISGNKTVIEAGTECPDTDLQVNINKNLTRHDLDTNIAVVSGAVHNIEGSLSKNCSGFETSLSVNCEKVKNNIEIFGTKQFTQNNKHCWSGHFGSGNYVLSYGSGAFLTNSGYTLGSGTLTTEKYA
tara:strand:- start:35 stop:778 length:744 start_codon:yes stop_codon:yes gene_type:complete